MAATFTIGKLAKAAGVNIETIRYYQRVNLIDEPAKPVTGYRQYPAAAVARLQFIKRSQELGFTLKEIQELLALGDGRCQEVQAITRHKIQQIDSRLHDLEAMRSALSDMLQQCQREDDDAHCAIIEALTR